MNQRDLPLAMNGNGLASRGGRTAMEADTELPPSSTDAGTDYEDESAPTTMPTNGAANEGADEDATEGADESDETTPTTPADEEDESESDQELDAPMMTSMMNGNGPRPRRQGRANEAGRKGYGSMGARRNGNGNG